MAHKKLQTTLTAAAGLPPGLYIIATPIGNMGDITQRAVEVLGKVDVIACEDTRVTGKLTAAHGLTAKKLPYHDHNAEEMRPRLVGLLKEGQRVALVSDAGMPLISDPGYKLVRQCIAEDIPVTCLPGATASLTALALSGLPTDRFLFAGFLPPRPAARQKALAEIRAVPATLIFYETAARLAGALEDMQAVLGDRPAAVARELTKKFEEVRRGSLSGLAAHYHAQGAPRGEIVVVVGAAAQEQPDRGPEDIDALLQEALATMSLRDAAAAVAEKTGRRKRELYQRALQLREEG